MRIEAFTFPLAASALVVAACSMDAPPNGTAQPSEAVERNSDMPAEAPANFAALRVPRSTVPRDLLAMAQIRQNLMRRLHAGGHTKAELLEAANAQNMVRVRALLGMSVSEYARYKRHVEIAAQRIVTRGEYPRAPRPHGPPRPRSETSIEEDADCNYVFLSLCALAAAKVATEGSVAAWVLAVFMMRECLCKWCWGVTAVC